MRTEIRPPEAPTPMPPARRDRSLMVGLAVAAVWLAVGAISVFSPDLVTGSAQEHVPIAAITVWFWGAVATGFVLMPAAMVREATDGRWRVLAIAVAAIWLVIALAAIVSPEIVTGSDPTRVPIAALVAPVAGTIATGFVCLYVAGLRTD
ncbi:MAG TPA: hypothetical protein VF235_08415 [Actinomycetota bacterium]